MNTPCMYLCHVSLSCFSVMILRHPHSLPAGSLGGSSGNLLGGFSVGLFGGDGGGGGYFGGYMSVTHDELVVRPSFM